MAAHEMVLAEDSESDKVITYLSQLKENVDKLQAEAARINKYQTLFKVGAQACFCVLLGNYCTHALSALFVAGPPHLVFSCGVLSCPSCT